jgi:hypothetical protein
VGSRDEQRDAYLRAQIELEETIVAAGPQAIVTDRRILFGWSLNWPPHVGEWTHDALTFDEIIAWSEGRLHDERPLLRLGHPSHRRLGSMPAHRFLWFRWGNATGDISHEQTTFSFAHRRDPVYRAMRTPLELADAVHGEPFVELPSGTRQERLGRNLVVFEATTGPLGVLTRLRQRLARLDHDLHHGQITWWIRGMSWLLLAVPAWFLSPWLALPAVVLAEVAWVAGLQWSRHRDRRRHATKS